MKKARVNAMLALVMLAFVSEGNAQKDSTNGVIQRKNEIGLDIGSFVLFSLGSSSVTQPIGITYKRVMGNWAFRTNLALREREGDKPEFNHDQVYYNDSAYYVRSNYGSTRYYVLRTGLEYRHQFKRNFMLVAGCDLQAQLIKGKNNTIEYAYRIDSVANPGTAAAYNYTTLTGNRSIMQETTRGFQAGLGFSAGLLFPMGKRWSFLAQCRASAMVGPVNKTQTDNLVNTTTKSKAVFFDFETGPALAELSVFYRF